MLYHWEIRYNSISYTVILILCCYLYSLEFRVECLLWCLRGSFHLSQVSQGLRHTSERRRTCIVISLERRISHKDLPVLLCIMLRKRTRVSWSKITIRTWKRRAEQGSPEPGGSANGKSSSLNSCSLFTRTFVEICILEAPFPSRHLNHFESIRDAIFSYAF